MTDGGTSMELKKNDDNSMGLNVYSQHEYMRERKGQCTKS